MLLMSETGAPDALPAADCYIFVLVPYHVILPLITYYIFDFLPTFCRNVPKIRLHFSTFYHFVTVHSSFLLDN